MCLSSVYPESEIKKLPETISMWRLFTKEDGVLFSVNQGFRFKLGTNLAPKPFKYYGDDGKGFHCFLTRKDARRIRELEKMCGWANDYTIRKVTVNRKDVKVLGRTSWHFNYPRKTSVKTETAVVAKMTILSTKEGR